MNSVLNYDNFNEQFDPAWGKYKRDRYRPSSSGGIKKLSRDTEIFSSNQEPFKIGDVVEFIDFTIYRTSPELDERIGEVAKIINIDTDRKSFGLPTYYQVEFTDGFKTWVFFRRIKKTDMSFIKGSPQNNIQWYSKGKLDKEQWNESFLNEKLGVNKDVEILSDFIIEYLSKAEPDNVYIFQREDVPKKEEKKPSLLDKLTGKGKEKGDNIIFVHHLPKLNINLYKVIIKYISTVNYVDKEGKIQKAAPRSEGSFDPVSSKLTKDGYIFHFSFTYRTFKKKIWKHYIYHEVNHAIQFVKIGKKKMAFNPKYLRNNLLLENFRVFPYSHFLGLVYQTIKIEQGSFITELYGKLKYRDIKNIQDLKKYFTKRTTYEFQIANELLHTDVKKLFNIKSKIKEDNGDEKLVPVTTEEQKQMFFSILMQLGNKISEYENVEDFFKNAPIKLDINKKISAEELDVIMSRYTKYFNRVGKKMSRKLDKIYTLLYEYFESKIGDFEPSITSYFKE